MDFRRLHRHRIFDRLVLPPVKGDAVAGGVNCEKRREEGWQISALGMVGVIR